MKQSELGIYIHIPFCKRKCYYCDFVSFSYTSQNVEKYIETMKQELQAYDLNLYNVTTIYIGGGTPSIIDSEYITQILKYIQIKLKDNTTKWEDIEITIEVNPGTVSRNKLKDYKKIGINRISIGLQTTNNDLLKQIGRIHTFEDFLTTYALAKEVGFENCNVDLMLGLPNQTIQDLKDSLQKVIELNPNHISTYSLIIEEDTPLENLMKAGKLELPDEDLERDMFWYVKNTLELNGYEHYEISNFAKPGFISKHNWNCWEQKEYIGLGVAACSYLQHERYGNTNDMHEYLTQKRQNSYGKIIVR